MFCDAHTDTISDLFDALCLNRYYGWYVQSGDLETAEKVLEKELLAWQEKLASADYHHRIRCGDVSRATTYTDMWSDQCAWLDVSPRL